MVRISFTDITIYGLEPETKKIAKELLTPLVMPQVEADPYCRAVLQARMAEGSLPTCPLVCDVVGYNPSGPACKADAVVAGFPCQACQFWFIKLSSVRFIKWKMCGFIEYKRQLCQGVSAAGCQLGMLDSRSSLVKETFRIFDRCPRAWGTYQGSEKKSPDTMKMFLWWMFEHTCYSKNGDVAANREAAAFVRKCPRAIKWANKLPQHAQLYHTGGWWGVPFKSHPESFSPASPGVPHTWTRPLLDGKHDAQRWLGGGKFKMDHVSHVELFHVHVIWCFFESWGESCPCVLASVQERLLWTEGLKQQRQENMFEHLNFYNL